MAAVRMTALCDFERGGEQVKAGDVFFARGIEVMLLRKRRQAQFSRLVPTRPVEKVVEAQPEDVPRRRRSYRRRDMQAPEQADLVAHD